MIVVYNEACLAYGCQHIWHFLSANTPLWPIPTCLRTIKSCTLSYECGYLSHRSNRFNDLWEAGKMVGTQTFLESGGAQILRTFSRKYRKMHSNI